LLVVLCECPVYLRALSCMLLDRLTKIPETSVKIAYAKAED